MRKVADTCIPHFSKICYNLFSKTISKLIQIWEGNPKSSSINRRVVHLKKRGRIAAKLCQNLTRFWIWDSIEAKVGEEAAACCSRGLNSELSSISMPWLFPYWILFELKWVCKF